MPASSAAVRPSAGRGHLFVTVANTTKCRADSVFTHRPHVSTKRGKNQPPASGVNLQLPEQFYDLVREGDNVLFPHLHSLGRNTPFASSTEISDHSAPRRSPGRTNTYGAIRRAA
jgi:hypothetical protein